nr:VCBS repeat-containing protein [Tessaracoccus sp. SD287]
MRQILGVGDFSGDGRGDVLAIRNDGTLWVYLGTASGTIGSGRQVGHGWNTFARAFSPGDFTGDKKFDLIGQRLDGTVYAYKNLGGRWDAARRVMSGTQDWKLMA